MKKVYSLFVAICFGMTSILGQTIYVKQDATGANDGSSWENAFTDLQSALAIADGNEVWVAAGVYRPSADPADTLARFVIGKNVSLFGGFAGTESSVEERDLESNETILSGDLNGDDVDGNFDDFKEDNVLNVVYVDSLLTQVMLNGLTVSGGHNNPRNNDIETFLWAGAGVYALSAVNSFNCQFTQNAGGTGAAFYGLGAGFSVSTFDNCIIRGNMASDQAAVFISGAQFIEFLDCDFMDNRVSRGGLYTLYCDQVTISNCTFENNDNSAGFGGAYFNWSSTNVRIQNSDFLQNIAGNGGAMYLDGRDLSGHDMNNITLIDCVFQGNQAIDWGGGAIYNWVSGYTMINCSFTNNSAANTGGSIYNGGDEKSYSIDNSTFDGNTAGWGAGVANYGTNSNLSVSHTTFENNQANTSGGGVTTGFLGHTTIENCEFIENIANFGAGVFVQNDTSSVIVRKSSFTGNASGTQGGGISLSGDVSATVDSCNFELNSADFGAAINAGGGNVFEQTPVGKFTLANSIFNFNLAGNQAGAVNISNMDVDIYSCLFINNAANGDGNGGAISTNASDSTAIAVNIANSTFSFNSGALANHIAAWTAGIGTSSLSLQNNIFDQGGSTSYVIEDGTPDLISLGGNFSNDETLAMYLTHEKDQVGEDLDPMFVAPDDFDFHLLASSSCINAGVSEGAPEYDIEGNQRVEEPDIGAYEYQIEVGTRAAVVENNNQLQLAPNPTKASLQLRLENSWSGLLQGRIINMLGQEVRAFQLDKASGATQTTIDVSTLSSGTYRILLSNGVEMVVEGFVKG